MCVDEPEPLDPAEPELLDPAEPEDFDDELDEPEPRLTLVPEP